MHSRARPGSRASRAHGARRIPGPSPKAIGNRGWVGGGERGNRRKEQLFGEQRQRVSRIPWTQRASDPHFHPSPISWATPAREREPARLPPVPFLHGSEHGNESRGSDHWARTGGSMSRAQHPENAGLQAAGPPPPTPAGLAGPRGLPVCPGPGPAHLPCSSPPWCPGSRCPPRAGGRGSC